MEEVIKTMTTYKEFKKFCSEKACNGQWSMVEARACLQVIKKIDSIKVKSLFNKKKATEKAREDAFNKLKEVL